MILIPPAPYYGLPIPKARPGKWGYVYEPIDGKSPGTKPHVLKVSAYQFQEVIFIKGHYTESPKACPWVTL